MTTRTEQQRVVEVSTTDETGLPPEVGCHLRGTLREMDLLLRAADADAAMRHLLAMLRSLKAIQRRLEHS